MADVKQRRKTNLSTNPNEGQQKMEKLLREQTTDMRGSFGTDPRTVSSMLSLIVCVGLTWFLFQQSTQLAAVEQKYHLLKQEAEKFQDMENKVNLMSEKFESSSGILQEAASSIPMITKFEQEVSSLRNIISDFQNREQKHLEKMQIINEKVQNIIDSWKKKLEEMNTNTSNLKSEAKHLHSEVTSHINVAEHTIKSLSERLKDLEDSTVRNVKALNRQEDDELSKIEHQLHSGTKTTVKLEEQQNSILARNSDLRQKLADYESKVEECKTHLPTVESAIHSVVRVSSELIGAEKKMEDITMKVFNMEDDMIKAVSEIMDIQKILDSMQYENSILKLQNEVLVLKGKVNGFAESRIGHNVINQQTGNDGQ